MHLFATPFNVFFRNYGPKGALPLMENLEEREDYGVSKPEQFTWKQLLDGYACTECGRCNTVCPATNTGKPLFPKEVSNTFSLLAILSLGYAHLLLDRSLLWHCQHTVGSLHYPSLLTRHCKKSIPPQPERNLSMNGDTNIHLVSNHPTSSTSKRPAPKKIIPRKMSGICSLCQSPKSPTMSIPQKSYPLATTPSIHNTDTHHPDNFANTPVDGLDRPTC